MKFVMRTYNKHIFEIGDVVRFKKFFHEVNGVKKGEFVAFCGKTKIASIDSLFTVLSNTKETNFSLADTFPDEIDGIIVEKYPNYFIIKIDKENFVIEDKKINDKMQTIPNLVMRDVDYKFLKCLNNIAYQGINININVNNPVLLDADLVGHIRVLGEMIIAQRNNYNKAVIRMYTCEGIDTENTIFFEFFHVVDNDMDVIEDNFFENISDIFEFVGNNFAYASPDNLEEIVEKIQEQAKYLVFENNGLKIKK